MDDPKVKSLKDKADQATTDEESRAALRAYNKELFEKVKKIDSGVSDFADQLEKAILKRLGDCSLRRGGLIFHTYCNLL